LDTATLAGQVALVTGASRGIGRGIAIGLGEAGATVYVTGRTLQKDQALLSGTLPETAAMVTSAGGLGIAIECDHRHDGEVAAVFETIERDQGRLDILVNNAFGGPADIHELFVRQPFWDVRTSLWDDLIDVGLRSHFVAAQLAAPMMIAQRRGLIVNISSRGAKVQFAVLPYGVGKAALDRMTEEMAADLKPHAVAVVSLWPPPSSTEGMWAAIDPGDDPARWSSPTFTGRVVAALAAKPDILEKTGAAIVVRDLAVELGVEDTATL
jgi:dehydrogenase/reductase SDR family protein 1